MRTTIIVIFSLILTASAFAGSNFPTQKELVARGHNGTFNSKEEKVLWTFYAPLNAPRNDSNKKSIFNLETYDFCQGTSYWLPGMWYPHGTVFFFRTKIEEDEDVETTKERLLSLVKWLGLHSDELGTGKDFWVSNGEVSLTTYSF